MQIGGGELNVAVGVSRLGLKSAWISRLPKNALGRLLENRVRQAGVDTSRLVWADDGRLGLYFVEFGAAPRASSVLYDRAHSSISAIKPGEVDWKKVFDGAKWFHTSGITPALSDSAAAVAVGGELVDARALREGNFDVITSNARKFIDAVRAGRSALGK